MRSGQRWSWFCSRGQLTVNMCCLIRIDRRGWIQTVHVPKDLLSNQDQDTDCISDCLSPASLSVALLLFLSFGVGVCVYVFVC